ncbi:BTB/POZ domain-containing protein 6-B-like [Anopheles ziemanni]|uniref:BTB/POZ domain-containing protein 6-B-like n=1 Tax=Anopheles coustani TaxID=139045 RepID=UPI00265B348F|nr:BTB/POZ domain-containing protein 6-B-like [Anopheles coustani]XP_058175958.1 BTB/POZ domain-containing protein 6-B-like [Anopheles ziemanni]
MALVNNVKPKIERVLSYDAESSTSKRKQAMVNNEFLADVVFIVGSSEKRIYAHKLLLVMSSEYFYIMFYGNFAESQKRDVVLKEDDPDVFLSIMRYIYTGEISITFENLRELFDCAQKFMLTELTDLIQVFMLDHLVPESTLRILNENQHIGLPCVNEIGLALISSNPLFYFNHVDLQLIDKQTFAMILKLKQINCSEDQLHMALETWAMVGKPEDDVEELSNIIDNLKRTYDCHELRLFGQRRVEGYLPGDLQFTLDSKTPVSLYGIGMFIKSSSRVITVELKIYQEDEKVCSDSYEITNKHLEVVHVVNLFFEEVIMLPTRRYKIVMVTSTSNCFFAFHEPTAYHDNIKLRFHSARGDSIAFAHFLCKENKSHNYDQPS